MSEKLSFVKNFNNMRFLTAIFLVVSQVHSYSYCQNINPKDITIVRDKWGVPHIYGKTDADAAYGLAWANCEDDFVSVQEAILSGSKVYSLHKGKEGLLFDFILQFTGIDTLVDSQYETSFSEEFKKVLSAYVQGVNDFAKANPKEVLLKKYLPFTERQIVKSYCLKMILMSGLGMNLKAAREGFMDDIVTVNQMGSNAIAIAPSRTEDKKTWLISNSHQPMEGNFAWYEAHVKSENGWNMIGGLFPGGVSLFIGTNENLGWAHTMNYPIWGDLYEMEVNPKNKNQYKYDGEWKNFNIRKAKLKIKLPLGIKLPVKKKIRDSDLGPVFETKNGWYATRFPSYHEIRYAEQWWRMNKAQNFDEFKKTIQLEYLSMFNILYADKEGNIYFISDGKYPKKDPKLDWSGILKGNSSSHKWTELQPFSRKPQVLNPTCGFLYNANNTPMEATCPEENWNDFFIGVQTFMYNRGDRFKHLLNSHVGDFTWDKLLEYKFDKKYHPDATYMDRFGVFFTLDEAKYPKIEDVIKIMKAWDLDGEKDNVNASVAMLAHHYLKKKENLNLGFMMIRQKKVQESDAVEALTFAKKFLLKHYKTLEVPLGNIQRHIRGEVSLPLGGLSEVPRAIDNKLYDKKNGVFRGTAGDCFIQYVKYPSTGLPEIESINAYGASARKESKHYTDQMQLFVEQKTKKMTLDDEEIKQNAAETYHPGERKK